MAEITAETTLHLMRSIAEAAGWRADVDRAEDGSVRVRLSSQGPATPAPVKPLTEAELAVRRTSPARSEGGAVDVSVIFGTYERFEIMRRAVESVRSSVANFRYECVVCDGGSADGSREWLAAQPDVVLVGKRSLDGAVDAFNRCYDVARGRYVANFNDDAIYQEMALAEAIVFMDENPDIGQAIFPFRGEGEDYVVNQIYPGQSGTEYANFGITRREAIEQVAAIQGGFWNPIYRTYAADCEQSAWVHRLGWRVARFENLRVTDVRTKDGLRARNESRQAAETKLMYYRWPRESFRPDGPSPRVSREEMARYEAARAGRTARAAGPRPTEEIYAEVVGFPLPGEESRLLRQGRALRALDPVEGQFPARVERLPEERVLYVHLETKVDPQAGLDRALRRLGSGGYAKVGWMEYEHGPRQEAIAEAARALRPTLVLMQLQAPNAVDVETVRRIREVSDPRCVVATWCGDIADVNSPWGAEWQVPLGRACDLTLHSSFSHVRVLRSLGVHNSQFMNIGFDQVQYRPPVGALLDFDVCFLGSRYSGDVFSQSLKWHDAALRNDAVVEMRRAFGDRFGLFGRGWGGPEQVVPLDRAHEVYWRSKIGLNVSLANYMEAYSSDRLHRILGCGCLLLTKRFPLMSTWGLRDGENCLAWDMPKDAVRIAKEILTQPGRLDAISRAGAELAMERHTWDARMHELAALVEVAREARDR